MVKNDLEITNRLGLHARPAAKLVHLAGSFASQVTVIKDGEEVDAKSILGVLQLGAAQGTKISIRCDGNDEDEALEAVSQLFQERFGEET